MIIAQIFQLNIFLYLYYALTFFCIIFRISSICRTAICVKPSKRILAEVSSVGSPRPRPIAVSWCILCALLAATRITLQRQVWSPRGKR